MINLFRVGILTFIGILGHLDYVIVVQDRPSGVLQWVAVGAIHIIIVGSIGIFAHWIRQTRIKGQAFEI